MVQEEGKVGNNSPSVEEFFDTPAKRREVITNLQSLRAHPGWSFLQIYLDKFIKHFEALILDNEDMDKEEEHNLKMTRNDYIFFKELPSTIVHDQTQQVTAVEPNDDPYATNEDIEQERGILPGQSTT